MDCNKLRKDIEELNDIRDKLNEKINNATETGKGKTEIVALAKEAEEETDAVLEQYLDDFFEKNPQLLSVKLSEHCIEGFKDKDGYETTINAISPLPNGNMLIGGWNGALYECQKQPDGSYKLSEHRIEGFEDKDGDETHVFAISPLPNGNMLIGGHEDALYEYQKQPDGSYKLSEHRIEGFENKYGYENTINAISPLPSGNMLIGGSGGALYEYQKQPDGSYKLSEHCIEGFRDDRGHATTINAISPLPNGNMLVGGHYGALYEYQKQPDGSYKLGEHRIEGFEDKDGDETDIHAISPLPNGNMLIGGCNGALYEYQKQPDGSYKLSEHRIEGFEDKDGDETDIHAIFPLSNGNMLIGGRDGALYEYQKQPDGSYKLSEHRIEGFENKYGHETAINAISPLPNGNMLIGGKFGALHEAQVPLKSLETLKQSLDQIIEQE